MFCIAYGITGEARTRAMLLEADEHKQLIRSMVDIVKTHNGDVRTSCTLCDETPPLREPRRVPTLTRIGVIFVRESEYLQ
jgi:hypothetical protein